MKRDHEISSGNVFADLGFRNAEQELLKARLTLPVSVSVGRLLEFLNALGQDVEVTVKPAPRRRKAGTASLVVQSS